jgi:hypothetical protein
MKMKTTATKENRQYHLLPVLFLIGFFATHTVGAQILQPFRFEREQRNSDDYFHVISLKEKGLALFRERDKYKNSNRIWELIFLDTELKEKKTLELEIKDRHKMVGYEVAEQDLYFLFRTGETNKNDFVLIDISLQGVEKGRHNVKPDMDFRLTHFIKAGNNFVFGGYVSNESVLLIFDPTNSSLKVVPGFFQKDTELVDLRTNQNQTFNAVLINRTSRGERKMTFRTFDDSGKQLLEDAIPIDDDISLQTGLSSALEREDLLIAGTYGERNAKQSQGFYSVAVDPFGEQKINYVDFGQLKNFVSYLNEKRAERIKQNSKEAVAEGRQPGFTSYVMPFRIVENKNGYFLLAEVYNPSNSGTMQTTNPYYYNPYYSPFGYSPYWGGYYYPGMSRMYRPYMYGPPNSRTSDETKSLETVVIALDEHGKVKWDHALKLEEVRMPSLQQIGDFIIDKGKVHIIYKKESDLKLKTILLEDNLVSEQTEKVKTLEEADVIRSEKETESGVRHWFGNSFYVWGYQTIRNNTKQDRVRDVFYINRIDSY